MTVDSIVLAPSVALGVLRLIVYHIRKCGIENIWQRRKVERLYLCFELHSRILNAWLLYVFPPTIVAFFWTVVITLFIAIRHTDLPLYFYMFFPIIGSSVMAVLFLVSYHMHCVSTGAEEVVASLMDQQTYYVKVMTKEDRIKLLKRVKAFRPFKIVLGPFANFSLSFPVDLWEEVINQLLFLMSF